MKTLLDKNISSLSVEDFSHEKAKKLSGTPFLYTHLFKSKELFKKSAVNRLMNQINHLILIYNIEYNVVNE